jgi:hypothetical protein
MNYGQLIERTQTVLRRTGADIEAVIVSGLEMAHAEIQNDARHDWKCQEHRTASGALPYTAASSPDGIALPEGFLRHRDLWVEKDSVLRPLDFIGEDDLRQREAAIARGEQGRPRGVAGWTLRNNRIVLWPDYTGSETLQLRLDYYAALPFYTAPESEDWFSQQAPHALVFGAAWLVCLNLWNDERAAGFAQVYQGFLQKAVDADKRNPEGPKRAYSPPREYYGRSAQ